MGNFVGETVGTAKALAAGLFVTFRTMFKKTTTEGYPDEPVHFLPRYR